MSAAGWDEDSEARKTWFKGGKSKELVGTLRLDYFHQSKYLLPGVNMRLKLLRSKDEFVLLKNAAGTNLDQKVVIEKACLRVRRVRVNPAVLAAHEEKLLKNNAIYPIQQTDMMTYSIATGAIYNVQKGVIRGQLPKLVIVGLVPSADFTASSKNTPLRFKNEGISQISLHQNGQCVPYSQPIEMDWTAGKELVTQAYIALLQNLELLNDNQSNGIAMANFMDKWTLYAFNLTPDFSVGGECGQPFQTANLRLEIKFAAATTESINVIVMSIRDGHIEVSKQRQVFQTE